MFQCVPNLRGLEAAVLEKACLFRPRRDLRRGLSEFPAPCFGREDLPVPFDFLKCRRGRLIPDSAFAQLGRDAPRPESASCALPRVRRGVAPVVLQSLLRQLVERPADVLGLLPFLRKLAFEFAAAVLAPGERGERKIVRGALAAFFAQASASSAASSSSASAFATAALLVGIASARMPASISSAISGLSLRYRRTLSLPCPRRSPL